MDMHCLKCKGKTESHGHGIMQSKNGRYRVHAKCSQCGSNKSKFISNQHAQGLLSGLLGFKDGFPFLNKIPILGQLL